MGFKTRRSAEKVFVMSRGDQVWKVSYAGRSFQTWQGRDADFRFATQHDYDSAGEAKAAANELIRIKHSEKYQVMDPRRIVPTIANTRYCTAKSLSAHIDSTTSKAPAGWRKELKINSYLHEEGVFLYEGDMKVDNLRVGPNPLVVTGSLHVDGLLSDGCDADETSLLVLGDLNVENLFTGASILVAGDVYVRNELFGFSSHDHVFNVGGKLTAHAVIDGDHWFSIYGGGKVSLLVGEPKCLLQPLKIGRVVDEPHLVLRDDVMNAGHGDGYCLDPIAVSRLFLNGAKLLS